MLIKKIQKGVRSIQLFMSGTRLIGVGLVHLQSQTVTVCVKYLWSALLCLWIAKTDSQADEREIEREVRVCQYAGGLLISSSSSGGMGGQIIRHLPSSFFSNSTIFRFFTRKNYFLRFYIPSASSSFRFCQPVYHCSLTYWLISSIEQIMSSLRNRDWPMGLNDTFKWVRSQWVSYKRCGNNELCHAN